jgi:hypothetical protein
MLWNHHLALFGKLIQQAADYHIPIITYFVCNSVATNETVSLWTLFSLIINILSSLKLNCLIQLLYFTVAVVAGCHRIKTTAFMSTMMSIAMFYAVPFINIPYEDSSTSTAFDPNFANQLIYHTYP